MIEYSTQRLVIRLVLALVGFLGFLFISGSAFSALVFVATYLGITLVIDLIVSTLAD